jgi:hypothetical protein
MCIENMYSWMPGTSYTSLPFHPTELIMNNWVQNLYDLIYLPWPLSGYGDGGQIFIQSGPKEVNEETGTRMHIATSVLREWASEPGWNNGLWYREEERRTDLNFLRAIRNIYREYGWPNHFVGTTFITALEAFKRRKSQLERTVRDANPMAFDTPGSELHPDEVEPRRQTEKFLEEAAGQLAIKRP